MLGGFENRRRRRVAMLAHQTFSLCCLCSSVNEGNYCELKENIDVPVAADRWHREREKEERMPCPKGKCKQLTFSLFDDEAGKGNIIVDLTRRNIN